MVDITKLTPDELEERQRYLQTVIDADETLLDRRREEVERLTSQVETAVRLRKETTAELEIRKLGGLR